MSEDQTVKPPVSGSAAKTTSSSGLSRRGFVGGGAAAGAALAAGVALRPAGAAPATRGMRTARYQDDGPELIIGTLGEATTINPFLANDSEADVRCKMLFDEFVGVAVDTYLPTPGLGLAADWTIDNLTYLHDPAERQVLRRLRPDRRRRRLHHQGHAGARRPSPAARPSTLDRRRPGLRRRHGDRRLRHQGRRSEDARDHPGPAGRALPLQPALHLRGAEGAARRQEPDADDAFFQAPVGAGPFVFESWEIGADFVATAEPELLAGRQAGDQAGRPTGSSPMRRPWSWRSCRARSTAPTTRTRPPRPSSRTPAPDGPHPALHLAERLAVQLRQRVAGQEGSPPGDRDGARHEAVRRRLPASASGRQASARSRRTPGRSTRTLQPIPYDPEGAKALIAAAGMPAGRRLDPVHGQPGQRRCARTG